MNAFRPQACADPQTAAAVSYLFNYDLQEGPPEKLSVFAGFLEAAEEHGLLWVLQDGQHVHRLPDGTVWGEFPNLSAAILAFERATEATSDLLGFPVRHRRRMVIALGESRLPLGEPKLCNPKLVGRSRYETSRLHQLFDPPRRPFQGSAA